MRHLYAGVVLALGVGALLLGAAAPSLTPGAGGLGAYKAMDVDAGQWTLTLDGQFKELTGGVKIVLHPSDPAQKPLPIQAAAVKFTYPNPQSKQPSRLQLDGNVIIVHPQAEVHSEHADWDMAAGLLTFTGNPVLKSTQIEELRCEKVIINFQTNLLQIVSGRGKGFKPGGADASPKPADETATTEKAKGAETPPEPKKAAQ